MKFLEQELNKLNSLYLGEKKSYCSYDLKTGEMSHKEYETGKPKKNVDMVLNFRKAPLDPLSSL